MASTKNWKPPEPDLPEIDDLLGGAPEEIENIVPQEVIEKEIAALRMSIAKDEEENRLLYEYKGTYEECGTGPYRWQVAFHDAGHKHRYRAIIAGNRVGKTMSCSAEMAIHLTGRYPDWWKGHQFICPIEAWACGTTAEDNRNIQQLALLGTITEDRSFSGTGWIPRQDIVDIMFRQGMNVANVVETVKVRHITGGVSTLSFKAYTQHAVKFQGVAKHLVWCDEEPDGVDKDIFPEIKARLIDHRGLFLFSRTPLFGLTDMIRYFLEEKNDSWKITVGWLDCPHWTKEMVDSESKNYPAYEIKARMEGIPKLGSGGIYPISEELFTCDPFQIPEHFRRICGVDLGIQHPTAAVWLAHDPDTDIVYVSDTHRKSDETVVYHSAAIKTRGAWIPVVLPHDSLVRTKSTGEQMIQLYRDQGVNVMDMTARYKDETGGGQSAEPIILEVQERMRTGRLKIFSNQTELFKEISHYHRVEGKINRIDDDLISAMHYAIMSKRWAISGGDRDMNEPEKAMQYQDSSTYDPYDVLS